VASSPSSAGCPPGAARASRSTSTGHMEFDLNGYEGRACAKEVDQIERVLQERFQVRMARAKSPGRTQTNFPRAPATCPRGGAQAHG